VKCSEELQAASDLTRSVNIDRLLHFLCAHCHCIDADSYSAYTAVCVFSLMETFLTKTGVVNKHSVLRVGVAQAKIVFVGIVHMHV
jgi:hypothetical protein